MKKCGGAFICFLFIILPSSLKAATYPTYEQVEKAEKHVFIKTYVNTYRTMIKNLVKSVVASCKPPHIDEQEEVKKIDAPYFYEVIIVPILKNKHLFEAPNYPSDLKTVTDQHRYVLIKAFAEAMEAYAKAYCPKQAISSYTMRQPPAPWQHTQEEAPEWEKKIHDHFVTSYKLSQQIYKDFTTTGDLQIRQTMDPTKATGISTAALVTAYLMSNWSHAKDIREAQKKLKKAKKEEQPTTEETPLLSKGQDA